MKLIDYLRSIYNYGDPIFINSIRIGGKSKTSIREQFSRLTKNGYLSHDGPGVYSLIEPNSNLSRVNTFEKIVEQKFIYDKTSLLTQTVCVYGYYSGLTFLNIIGISQQVPAVLEITTNKTSSKKRIYKALGREAILRKPRIMISYLNYKILQFIDMFYFLSIDEVKNNQQLIIDYMKKEGLTESSLSNYLMHYSPETIIKIKECGLFKD